MTETPPDLPNTPPNFPSESTTQAAQTHGMVNTASTAITEIDPEFKDIALQKVRNIVDGNGIKAEDLKYKSFEGVTLQFLATTKLQLRFKTIERIEAGKKAGPVKISGPQQLRDEIAKMEQKHTHRADSIKRIQAFVAEERKDMGYGLDGQMFKLPFLTTDYVTYEACQTCKAKGSVACQRCHAQGFEMCPQCHGQGLEICVQCSGTHFINTPNGRQQCTKCHGKGKQSCSLCHERRKIQCRICKTKGSTLCTVCNGHAWTSRIYSIEVEAMPNFDYDKTNIQSRVGEIIESLGPKLVIDEHVKIKVIYKERDEKLSEDQRDFIAIPYVVTVPYGELHYTIGQDTFNTMIFGYKGALYFVPMLLDKLLKKPLARLKEAAENRGNVADKIKQAGRFKAVRLGILAASRLPLNKAAAKVKKENPHGLRNASIKEMVTHADRALKNITSKPRKYGMYGAFGFMAVLYGAYFAGNLRAALIAGLPDQLIQLAIDISVLAIAPALGVYIVKLISRKAMLDALGGLLPPGKQKSVMPKVGKAGERIALSAPLIYIGALILTHQLGLEIPWWATQITAQISSYF